MNGFFYGQTEYSLLENAIHMDDYINHAVENGFSFLTITDKNMHGHYKFYKKCLSNNIKPIIGLEVKITSNANRNNYILMYAKNNEGYQNLVMIATELEINKVVSDDFILAHNKGLILVSSALNSDFDYYIFKEDFVNADLEVKRYQNLCNEIYIGVMPSSFMYETICDDLKDIVSKNNYKVLPVSKCCYLAGDELVYLSLLRIGESNNTLSFDDLHLKTKEELELEFNEWDFKDLSDLLNSFETNLILESHPLLKYPNKVNASSQDYLKVLCNKGLLKRLSNSIKDINVYQERLQYELDIIHKMGYDDYFLIVWDFVKFAKQNKILVGMGRGSAPGSLVAYSLGITDVDPIEYNLLFERFLNPERVSMPDIDIDFPDDKRDLVINYVQDKYGKDHVCYISAFGTFQIKSSVRDLFRINGYDTKYIEPVIRLTSSKAGTEEITNELGNHPELLELIEIASKIEGLPRHISTHAAGIIISSNSLLHSIPLRDGINHIYQSQLEASDLEQLGLLKMDFLGIRNLSIVSDMIDEIKVINKDFDIKKISLDDEVTFKLLQQGDTLGIFQLESTGITNVIKKMKPTHFEDLVAVLALYRPGPMDNIDDYIKRKHGEEFSYLHPDLEPILKDTYGIIIYQEQIMRIAQKFAGYSLGEADVLRRAVSKKKKEILESERIKFVEKSKTNGYDESIANQIYDYIAKFADYGFNRSHSVAYGLFSYQMAYLKANYLNIFLSKLLNNVIGNDSELANYVKYTISKGIKVYNPDVNISTDKFVLLNSALVMPINAIHSIGTLVANKIIVEREKGKFKDFFNFKKRMGSEVNSKMMENLVNASFFDSFNLSHSFMLSNLSNEYDGYISEDEMVSSDDELSLDELRNNELSSLGFNLKYDLFKDYLKYKELYKASSVAEMVVGKKANVVGLVKRVKTLTTKTGSLMAFVTLDVNYEDLDVVIFSETYQLFKDVLDSKKLVLFNGMVRMREEKLQLQLDKAKVL